MITEGALGPWSGMLAICMLAGAMLLILSRAQRRTGLRPETIRKLFHIGAGCLALALPLFFSALWPVLLLGAVMLAALLVLRSRLPGAHDPGQVLHAVSRHTYGDFWFIAGVVVCFAVADGDVLSYGVAILILSAADSVAALVGVVSGRHAFRIPGGSKTLEGSAAFFLTALACVVGPLALAGQLDTRGLVIAFNVALLVAMAEADAGRGLDNFVIPVLVVILVQIYLEMPTANLLFHALVIVGLGALAALYGRHTTLDTDSLIGAVLAGYVLWSCGGGRWLLPPLVLFLAYRMLIGRWASRSERPFNLDVLLALAAPAIVLAAAYALVASEWLYFASVGYWSAVFAVYGLLRATIREPKTKLLSSVAWNIAKAASVLAPGLAATGDLRSGAVLAAAASIPASVIAALLREPRFHGVPGDSGAPYAVPLYASSGTLASFLVAHALGAV